MFSALAIADNTEEIIIKNLVDGVSINYKSTIINIIENEPITFVTDGVRMVYLGGILITSNDIFETGESRTNSILEYDVDILEGSIKDIQEDEIITNGKLLIDSNVGKVLLDKDGVFLEGKNRTYYIGNGKFNSKNRYKSKFKEIEKEKEESRLREENEDLRQQIKEIRDMLTEKNYTSNNNLDKTENILKNKGELTVNSVVPEGFKDDIFIELEPIEPNGEINVFYLSPNNNFTNKQSMVVGDYNIKSIYFLNDRIKDDYRFNHNYLVKILENQSIFLNIETIKTNTKSTDTEKIVEDKEVKDEVDEVLDTIEAFNSDGEEGETEKQSDKRIFFFLALVLIGVVFFLVFKFKDKILYKD